MTGKTFLGQDRLHIVEIINWLARRSMGRENKQQQGKAALHGVLLGGRTVGGLTIIILRMLRKRSQTRLSRGWANGPSEALSPSEGTDPQKAKPTVVRQAKSN